MPLKAKESDTYDAPCITINFLAVHMHHMLPVQLPNSLRASRQDHRSTSAGLSHTGTTHTN